VAFGWTGPSDVQSYQLDIGTTGPGSTDIYSQSVSKATGATVNGLPTDGRWVYIRLTGTFPNGQRSVDARYQAAGGVRVRALPVNGRVAPGGTLTAAVEVVLGSTRLGSWTVDLTFDASVVTPTGCTLALSGATGVCSVRAGGVPNLVRISGAIPDGVTGTVRLANVALQGSGAHGAASVLQLSVPTLTDQDGATLNRVTEAGAVQVVAPSPDANGDGRVDATDALCVLRLLGGFTTTTACPIPLPMPDVNSDGLINATDALCVLRYIGGFTASAACPLSAPATAGR